MIDRSAALVATLLVLAAGAAGCGQDTDSAGDFSGAERQVADAVEDLQAAAVDGEEERICRQLLSAELARAAGDCPRAVEAALDETDTNEITVEEVRVQGRRATVRAKTGTRDEQEETFELVRERDAWRFAKLGR